MTSRPGLPAARLAGLLGYGLLLMALGVLPGVGRAQLPVGKAEHAVELNGTALRFFSYKPSAAADGPLIVGFHGSDRRAEAVRDFLVPLADRRDAIVITPLLDEERFPRWRYQWAGVVEPILDDGVPAMVGSRTKSRVRGQEGWTVHLVLALVEHVRAREGRPEMPYYLIGHSAGAQLLGRLSAFTGIGAERIVLANPGSYIAPTRRRRFPYGFGGLPEGLRGDAELRRYLEQPLTIYLGTEDRRRKHLDKSAGAERQGATRHERGRNVFDLARETAAKHGWAFAWRLVEAPGIGHDSRKMYGAEAAADALFGESSGDPPAVP